MIRKWLAVLWLAIASTSAAAADRIERVEPASWWVGMKDDRLQLLVHGDRVAELQPKLSYPGVTLVSAERVENPNYLFVNLRIAPETRPGTFRIDFRKGRSKAASRSYVLNARAPGSADRASFGPQDTIYLITPDRFANGDPSNDTVQGLPDGRNRTQPLGRHGGWQGEPDRHRLLPGGPAFRQQREFSPARHRRSPARRRHDHGHGPEPLRLAALVDARPAEPRLVQQRQPVRRDDARARDPAGHPRRGR